MSERIVETASFAKPRITPEDVRLAVSGHDNTKILESNYDGRNAMEVMQEKYAELLKRPDAAAALSR